MHGGALVVPGGLLKKMQNEQSARGSGFVEASADARSAIELLAMEAVFCAERQLGFKPRDVSSERIGYDIESHDPNSGNLRFIEVKGRVAGADTVSVTRNEILTALNAPNSFILAIVSVANGFSQQPCYVRKPLRERARLRRNQCNLQTGGSACARGGAVMTRTAWEAPFRQELAPVATRRRQREGLVRPVTQVILRLRPKDECAPFEAARGTVLEWMARRAGKRLPNEAHNGESFSLDDVGAQRTEAVAIPTPRYWAARLDDADKSVAQRVWTTEIGIGEQKDGTALLGCRLQCVTRGDDIAFDRSIPRFVRDIVEQHSVELEGRSVSVEPWFIDSEEEIDELVALLLNPNRRCDAIVFSLPEGSSNQDETSASAVEVARRTAGAAHVAVISGAASYALSDRVGKEFSVYRQAVRTYRPGFDPGKDELFSHPLGLPGRITEWQDGGPAAYERLLISQAFDPNCIRSGA